MSFYNFAKVTVSLPLRLLYRVNIEGTHNIPTNKRLIICSNHASILDPVFLAMTTKRKIHFMAKKEIFKNKFLKYIFNKVGTFPVDRDGADLSAIKTSLKVLKKEHVLGIFPEGTRVKALNLDNAKSGVAMISIKGKSPILPVFINSTYKPFTKVNIRIGDVIDLSEYYSNKLNTDEYKEISKSILKKIYSLNDNL